jgi:hypothetical protein
MKKLTIILSFLILTSTTFATSVGGSIGGWNIVSQVGSGIGQKLTATKEVIANGASKVITGTANITPNPTGVAKFMARVGGVALVVDAMDLILDGVDYVMDPVNNTVTYHNKDSQTKPTDIMPYHPHIYYSPDLGYSNRNSESAVIDFVKKYFEGWGYFSPSCSLVSSSSTQIFQWCTGTVQGSNNKFEYGIRVNKVSNPAYDPAAEDESKPVTVPLSDVGTQVLDQAEADIRAGNPASPAVALSRAVAEAQAKEAELDDKKAQPIVDQFQKNPEYPSVNEGEGTITTPEITDPITGEVTPPQTSSISMKFPKACEWFPQACEFIDWMKTDPNIDSEMELPEKELEKQEIKDDLVKISSGRCPMDARLTLNELPFGMKVNKSYSYQEICNTVEPMKYVFKLITIIFCVLILVRV